MIQDIFPSKMDNRYFSDKEPQEDSIIFCFRGNEVLNSGNADALFPTSAQFKITGTAVFLFSVDEKDHFLIPEPEGEIPEGFRFSDVKKLRRLENARKADLFAAATANHLYRWYDSSRFCGECGGKTVPCTRERAVLCTQCGELIYPRINPAVIVGIKNGDSLLIARYIKSRGVEHDVLVAGYMEIGETPEDTVRREVMEEVGLKVKNIRYYGSQPWGYTGGLLLGFFCDVDGSTEVTLDPTELSGGIWVKREDIQGQPDDLSLTNEMMISFREGRNT